MLPFNFIRRRISRKISAWLLLCSIPMVALCGWWIIDHQTSSMEEMILNKGITAAEAGAGAYSVILTNGVNSGAIKMEDIVNPTYKEFSYENPTPIQRFHSGVDTFTDSAGIQVMQDAILGSSPDFLYALGNDKGTYIPTTNSKLDHAPGKDEALNHKSSRQKRKYLDELHITAAETTGLLVQSYHRDTGDLCWDVAVPIWVNGKHFGSFRVGVMRDRIATYKYLLTVRLGLAFMFLLTGLWALNYLLINNITRNLENLSYRASEISMGEGLDVVLKTRSIDEVGELYRSFNRLRCSLQFSMSRLQQREERSEGSKLFERPSMTQIPMD